MAEHTIDIPTFRLLFPAFANTTTFPDAYISAQWDAATAYISPWDSCFVGGRQLQQALNLMTAHLMQINVMMAANGATPTIGVFQSATIDKVTVANMPPPATNGWKYWLATTPYGLQLWALLKMLAGPGFYIGGLPERAAFRKVGGIF